jgi:hypothetical protein
VVTPALLDLHEAFHRRFSAFGARSLAQYRPGNWVPHCTLAVGVRASAITDAVRLSLAAELPIHAWFQRVALVEFRPVRVLYSFEFADA